MASVAIPAACPAQQPGLLSFIVYDRLPEGCVAFEVPDDRQAPHLRRGDFAVVDMNDRSPMDGEIFLYAYGDNDPRLVEVCRFPNPEAIRTNNPDPAGYWSTYWRNTMFTLDGRPGMASRWFDGPWRGTSFPDYLKGRVVGIYQPDFRAMLAA